MENKFYVLRGDFIPQLPMLVGHYSNKSSAFHLTLRSQYLSNEGIFTVADCSMGV